jgi:predicted MPP superfamily phosphohydrolase
MSRVRSIFLSDIHLGTRACQAERLLEFLREYESDQLFLIGDIVDFWAMKRGTFWSTRHNTVVQKILKRARRGTDVVFIPGNHDEALREHVGISLGQIRLVREHIHTAVVEHEDGRMELIEWAGRALQTGPEVVRLTDAKSRPAEVEPAPVTAADGMPTDRPAAGAGRSAT